MSLWAQACHDVHRAGTAAHQLLGAPEKYRRLAGWYFIHHTVQPQVQHETAMRYITVRDPEELAWICKCLYTSSDAVNRYGYKWSKDEKKDAYPNAILPADASTRQAQFDALCEVITFIGNKKTVFEGSVFPWFNIQLDAENVAKCLVGLVGFDCDAGRVEALATYLSYFTPDARRAYYMGLLDPTIDAQRTLMLHGLSDKSAYIKEDIVKRLADESLTPTDINYLTDALTSTGSALRKSVLSLLEKQNKALVRVGLDKLLNAANNKQLLAGVELLYIAGEKSDALRKEYAPAITQLQSREKLPKDIAVLLARFDDKKADDDYTPENGYGLYDPAAPIFDKTAYAKNRPSIPVYNRNQLKKLLHVSDAELKSVLTPIRDVLVSYVGKELEVSRPGGGKEKIIFGDRTYMMPRLPHDTNENGDFLNYYMGAEILAALDKVKDAYLILAKIHCYGDTYTYLSKVFTPRAQAIFDGLPYNDILKLDDYAKPFTQMIRGTMNSIFKVRNEGLFDFALSVWKSLADLIPDADVNTPYKELNKNNMAYVNRVECMLDIGLISNWRNLTKTLAVSNAQFDDYWQEAWYQYLRTDRLFCAPHGIWRAKEQGLLNDDGIYHELLTGSNAKEHIRTLTSGKVWALATQKKTIETYPFLVQYLDIATERIVAVEEKRGELPTPLSTVAAQIGYFKGGAEHFAALLTAMGKDTFERGYMRGGGQTKRPTISALLKNNQPNETDTVDTFKAAVKAYAIPEKRVVQAVMYAPQWVDMAEKALNIPGLASAVWLFHAHINEKFNAEKETKVARYSPISQQEFADGTFDNDWFLDAYNTVGPKVFDELYKNAKNITDSNSAHRRSQLYTDAVLERLDKTATQMEITEKRSQEKLRAYGLIPQDKSNPADALERYEFIQKFAKESRQFGAGRKASEAKAVVIAMQNLAMTMGFGDADRMSWYLESEKMDSLRHLMQPTDLDGTLVWLEIIEDGVPAITVAKNGKPLKSLPKALAKNDTVMEIQTAVKDLRDQKKRARVGFELAMVGRTVFEPVEITRLLDHPVLNGLIRTLVFVSGDKLGFPVMENNKLTLVAPCSDAFPITKKDTLRIAHPYDILQADCWSDYQRHLFAAQITQPFKQVFREYYAMTQDERDETNISRRYAGHQVQPAKTVALLKTRGWTVDCEEGLQRVYHKENLIAKMYALADWFSPADIEAPTLEVIQFFTRDKHESVDFVDVPPVIFSETMRDIDLVVSVAHVGGVDPQASHSTVEMRTAIAKELLALLAVPNVIFRTTHAQIKGKHGEYSVHMGSGVIHQSGVGMLAVLPVHSQARERIFLPFADDDPKTAEILSKILLFADDAKIKDPAILAQMKTQ